MVGLQIKVHLSAFYSCKELKALESLEWLTEQYILAQMLKWPKNNTDRQSYITDYCQNTASGMLHLFFQL